MELAFCVIFEIWVLHFKSSESFMPLESVKCHSISFYIRRLRNVSASFLLNFAVS